MMEQDDIVSYTIITSEGNDSAAEEERCPGCQDPLHLEAAVTLVPCTHSSHRRCIVHRAIQEVTPRCFRCDCRVPVIPACTSPSGTMEIEFTRIPCPGFPNITCIVITYFIPAGVQLSYHPSPNLPYSETTRTAYLPNNEEGRCLLRRLIQAFRLGLTFTVGTSMTTGALNVVVWTPYFHHKTSLRGGGPPFGFPDPNYIANCNAQLDAIGVVDPPDPIVDDNQVFLYIAPTVQRPPSVCPEFLLPIVRANRTTGRMVTSLEQDGQDYSTIAEACVVIMRDDDHDDDHGGDDDGVVAPEDVLLTPRDPLDNIIAPDYFRSSMADDEPCALCGAPLSDAPASRMIRACHHFFHEHCILPRLLLHQQPQDPHCPICHVEVDVIPLGRSPYGTLTIQFSGHLICPGFYPITTCIVLTYLIPPGTRRHANRRTSYPGTTRTAYLPNNDEGRRLLMRLIRAFVNGLTFSIGTSLTTGRENVVVWTRHFHHRTSLEGGPHGFPDIRYIATTNAQLDALGVPRLGPPSDLAQLHNRVIPYNTPPVQGPPPLLPDALLPVARAIETPPRIAVGRLRIGGGLPDHHPDDFTIMAEASVVVVVEATVGPQGTSPSGTMTIQYLGLPCPGFPNTTTIVITYHIPAGIQNAMHQNPNAPYTGTRRTAFLPDNGDGRRLLIRLIRAFVNGLTFTVGTSLTTGARNAVVWTRHFDHRTTLEGGPFGFPDPNYIATCNAQLDAIGVPHSWEDPSGPMVPHNEVILYVAPPPHALVLPHPFQEEHPADAPAAVRAIY